MTHLFFEVTLGDLDLLHEASLKKNVVSDVATGCV